MFDEERYIGELNYIFNQFPSYQKVGKIAYKEGLDSMIEFDTALEHPHRSYPTIHVAGTNGKGSVSHMLASVLMSCGLKVGLYTSPHLVDFRERMKINGAMISKERVLDFLLRWKSFMNEHKPSFFEITTAMAFDYFRKENVDIAIIETGLGGRLDSTNIINPLVSVITNIALDHCEHLGYSISAIAKEKAGIIKEGVPVVISEHTSTTKEIFERIALQKSASVLFSQDSLFKDIKAGDYELDLTGDCQINNLRAVLTTLMVLADNPLFLKLVGDSWSNENIRKGLKQTATATGLRGRWEILSKNPRVICDVGHNVNGLSVTFSQLRREKFKRLFIIIGFVVEKEIEKMIGLLPNISYYFFTQANISRALDADILAGKGRSVGLQGEVTASVEAAIRRFKRCTKRATFCL